MITYEPLRITLVRKGKELRDLQTDNGGVLNKRTVSKLRHDETVNIETIAKVCLLLDVPIEDVVRVLRND